MPDAQGWAVQSARVDDPLAPYGKRPIISGAGADATYVGRVVVELWDTPTSRDDADGLALTSDAADGRHALLLTRVAAALAERLQRERERHPDAPCAALPRDVLRGMSGQVRIKLLIRIAERGASSSAGVPV